MSQSASLLQNHGCTAARLSPSIPFRQKRVRVMLTPIGLVAHPRLIVRLGGRLKSKARKPTPRLACSQRYNLKTHSTMSGPHPSSCLKHTKGEGPGELFMLTSTCFLTVSLARSRNNVGIECRDYNFESKVKRAQIPFHSWQTDRKLRSRTGDSCKHHKSAPSYGIVAWMGALRDAVTFSGLTA